MGTMLGGLMDVLRKINKMRLDKKWSVYRLSVESGVSQSTLTNMFNRETLPSITTLELLCSAFGMTLSEFFAEENAISEIKDEDMALLDMYHSISDSARESIFALLKELQKK